MTNALPSSQTRFDPHGSFNAIKAQLAQLLADTQRERPDTAFGCELSEAYDHLIKAARVIEPPPQTITQQEAASAFKEGQRIFAIALRDDPNWHGWVRAVRNDGYIDVEYDGQPGLIHTALPTILAAEQP